MITGLVLIRLAAGKETNAIGEIKKIHGVKGATGTFGSWDAVAMVQGNDLETLADVVISKIRSIQGVAMTETLIEVGV